MSRDLHALLDEVCFVPLMPGIHQVTILDWAVATAKNGEAYIELTFAPSDNLEHKHVTAVFPAMLPTLANNLQRVLNMPGAKRGELLNAVKGKSIPATYEVANKDGKRYFNWYFGFERPTAESTPNNNDIEVEDVTPAPPPPRGARD